MVSFSWFFEAAWSVVSMIRRAVRTLSEYTIADSRVFPVANI